MLRLHLLPAVAVTLVAAGVGLLAGCGGSPHASYNDADVTFASEMVSHHRQAVTMVELLDGRDLDPAFVSFAESMRAAQEPQITELSGWLDDWDKPVPGPSAGVMKGMDMGGDASGMMTDDEMKALAATPDAAFEAQWLRLMIEHHAGAMQMADDEISGGEHTATVDLARSIRSAQSTELTQMRSMLAEAAG